MPISGQETINIGAQNQTQGSDDLYTAFNKVQNNFTQLFSTASPFNTYIGGNGIQTSANSISGVVTITNTGVLNLFEGSGVALSGSNGNVIISLTGNGNVGVTSVGVVSPANTLSVANTPIVSSGNIAVDLQPIPLTPSFAPGEYIAPTLTVDQYGRVNAIANTAGVGTVSNIAITAVGEGLSITGSPITNTGVISIQNTGVTSIRPGTGIQVNNSNGEVTIAALNVSQGTVTRIDFSSNTLVVTGSPVTTSGNITVDLPANINLSNISSNTIVANISVTSPNINANLFTGNYFVGSFDGIVGNNSPNAGFFTNATISGNILSGNANLGNAARANFFIGDGGLLSNLNIGNIGTVANATYAEFAGNVTGSSQPNITSLGNLTTLVVTGNSNVANLQANGVVNFTNTSNVTLGAIGNLRITGGSNGQVLKTNGSGVLSWANDTANAAGSNQQVQFNDGGTTFGGSASFTFNKTSNTLSVFNASISNSVTVTANVSSNNLSLTGVAVVTGNVTAGNLISTTGILRINTTLPVGAVGNGTVSIDIANNRMGVYFANVWRYTPISDENANAGQIGNLVSFDIYSDNAISTTNFYTASVNFTAQDSNGFIGVKGPLVGAGNVDFNLPNRAGNVSEFLTQDGSGNLQWSSSLVNANVPGSNSATGTAGQIAFDSGFVYVCVATNTWKRAALSSWP